MSTVVITAPDGHEYEINAPEGATDEEIMAYAQSQYKPKDEWADYDITQDMTELDKMRAGIGKGMTDVVRGIGQAAGFVDEEDIVDSRARDEALMSTGYGATGNVVGGIAATLPAALIPGANTMLCAGAICAGIGALQPVAGDESRAMNALIGGGLSAGMVPLMGAVSSAFAPKAAQGVEELAKEGVDTTIGQQLGGAWKTFEDKLTSVPFLGDKILARRAEGFEQFNQAAVNRALEPVGERLPAGLDPQQAVAHVRKTLGDKYDSLLGKMSGEVDSKMHDEVSGIFRLMDALPADKQSYFSKVLEREVNTRITGAGKMSGQSLKDIESALGKEISSFKGAGGFDGKLGEAFSELQNAFRGMIQRSNPEYAKSLQNINKGYANFKVVQNAAAKIGADEGLFTPAQLRNAVRMKDPSLDKRAFSEGTALMQDLAEAGKRVLPSTTPDSGTAGRMMATNPIAGSLSTLAGLPAAMMYTKPGSSFMRGLMGYRPQAVRAAGDLTERAKPLAAPVATGLWDFE